MKSEGKSNPKREILKQLSAPFKVLKKEGAIDSINEGLLQYYAEQGHSDLKTLHQWNKEGKRVKKGSEAFLVWAMPKKMKPKATPEADEMEFFPICYLFSSDQVEEAKR